MKFENRIFIVSALICVSVPVMAENLSGPRIGITYLSQETRDFAAEKKLKLSSIISQFGWQFERAFFTTGDGPQGITALVPMLGGSDQGVLLPSISWVTGMRGSNGYEFAFGPNVSVSGVGFAFALGRTNRIGDVNFPINISVVTSDKGARVSFLFGFNSANEK